MTLLFLSYLLGYQKSIRKGVWAVLAVCVFAVGLHGTLGFTASSDIPETLAADEETTDDEDDGFSKNNEDEELIVPAKKAEEGSVVAYLIEITENDDYEMIDKGNNVEFLEILQLKLQSRDAEEQASKLAHITEGLEDMSEDILKTTWNLYKDELLDVLSFIVEKTEDSDSNSSSSNKRTPGTMSDMDDYGISYKIEDYADDKKLVQFMFEKAGSMKRMNRHFGDGTTYSCERNQCARIHHIYDTEKSYTISIFATTRSTEGRVEEVTLNPRSTLTTMLTKKSADEDDKKTTSITTSEETADSEDDEDEEPLTEDEEIAEELEFIKDLLGIDLE